MKEPTAEMAVLRKTVEQLTDEIVKSKAEEEKLLNEFSSMNNELVNLQRQLAKSNAELSRTKEEAVRANDLKSTFLAVVSHEFRTPMNGILGMIEMLGSSKLSPDQRQAIGVIRESASLLLNMINNLLDISKVEAGQMELEIGNVRVEAIMGHVAQLLEPQIYQMGNRLSIETDTDVAEYLEGDSARIMQILLNLLNNANKFTSEGLLIVRTKLVEETKDSQRVRFEVQDSGIGISPEDQNKLFQPYVQAGEGSASQYGGTGLGLWICSSFVELMQGEIGVVSEEGQGSTFWFEIPFMKGSEQADKMEKHENGDLKVFSELLREHSHSQTILVAEDNRVNRQVVQLQLNHLGFKHIDFAEDGQAAVKAASEKSYACILMDHYMPLLNGHDAAKAIRQREAENQQPPVPIISLTGNVSEEDQARGREVGVNDYLIKPVTIEKLSEKLVKWLPKPETEPILDEEVIREIMLLDEDGSTGLLKSLVEMYTSDTPAKINKLRELAAAGEVTKVVEAAHELKSGSVSLGVGRLSSLLSDIEQLARENRLENAKAKLSALQSVYQATCLELERYIHQC
ncbi:signal transduction histidine kinase/CheY-like chemotaxis protein/HPt (histidine-containing phosphotransfer) domain-containing protein [Paenibacillus polymyxa]|uniref:ATP-binding protein n=1 Tax=Paenibacillus polymyxa TaxID=1406 RepID=UPI00278CC1BD|nr:ATP-binding protein [Paenibacillus polymyxa]MDQ0047979.1 signal transduction histidine kinase/CheY-like chemotaxis protein/HPt (histidine-containing phosphotransfer) domain-containing protein [Paenibacillus polymyxa]